MFAVPRARSNTMNADSMPNYVRLSVVKDGRAVNHSAAFEAGLRADGESIAKTAIKKLETAVARDEKYFGIKPLASWAINPENNEGVPMMQALSELATVLAQAFDITK
jgi:CT1975-like protein